MVSSMNDEDLPQSRLVKQHVSILKPMQTRRTRKLACGKSTVQEEQSVGMASGSVVCNIAKAPHRRASKKEKKKKTLSPTIVDVVFGKLQNSSLQEAKLRRKREEDAERCGRIVRTVQNVSDEILGQKSSKNASDVNVFKKDMTTAWPSRSSQCKVKMTPGLLSTEFQHQTMEDAIELAETGDDVEEPSSADHFLKLPSQQNLLQQLTASKAYKNSICRNVEDRALPEGNDSEAVNTYSRRLHDVEAYRRNSSPVIHNREKLPTRRESRRSVSPARKRQSYGEPRLDSVVGERWNNPSSRSRRVESRSPRQSRSRSPAFSREEREPIRGNYIEKDYQDIETDDRAGRGASRSTTEDVLQDGHHLRRHSVSQDSGYGKRSSASPYRSRRDSRSSQSLSKSRSPSDSMIRQLRDEVETNERALHIVKKEDVAFPSPAMDRRTRRYKQAVLEAEKCKRKREGKKCFYLTLDTEGKPCGPGRKAWLADINKLAAWLDPSCMHIRKQTYEDMCIFKDRLNENFEYSGDLNEDYLRALAGKAVTRKRTELISLIKRNGCRPSNMDDEIWKKLEKIANSKQRDERTEHGRHANACRKTLGRTGTLGVDGIREKLRELYGRSPDPHELRAEMERDKGFGRKEEGRPGDFRRRGKESDDDVLEEELVPVRPESSCYLDGDGEEGHNVAGQLVRRVVTETNESTVRVHCKETDMIGGGKSMKTATAGLLRPEDQRMKDEYIARLEAELLSLRGRTPEVLPSRKYVASEHTGRTNFGNDGYQRVYAGEMSTATVSARKKSQNRVPEMQLLAEY